MSQSELPTQRSVRTTTSAPEALAITAVCFGWAILSSTQVVMGGYEPRGFSDTGLMDLVGVELICGALALALLRWRGYGIATLRPAPNLRDAGEGLVLCGITLLLHGVIWVLFASGGASQPFDWMVERATVSWPAVLLLAVVNGAYEEVFLLGFLLRGLRGYGLSIALGASVLVRVLYHLYQGPVGALSVLVFGLVLGLAYVRTGRLFPAIVAHAAADVMAFVPWPGP